GDLGFPCDWRQSHGVMGAIDFTGIAGEQCADLRTAASGKGTLVELKNAGANSDRPTRRTTARFEPYRTGIGAPKVAKLQGKRLPWRQAGRSGEQRTSPGRKRISPVR